MSQTCSMKQIGTRNLGYAVEQMEWSNKMDLIAYGTDKGEVIIQRLNWQKIVTFPSLGEHVKVRSLSWQLDETILAVAYSNGKVVLLDAEREDSISSITYDEDIRKVYFSKAIVAKDYRCSYRHREEHTYDFYQPALPQLSDIGAPIKTLDDHKSFSKGAPCFLVVIMPSGKVHLLLLGALKAGTIDLSEYAKNPKDFTVYDVCLNGSNNAIYALVRDDNQLKVLHFENQVLQQYMSPILHLAVYCANSLETKNYINNTMQCMLESWETVLLEMDNKLTKYANHQAEGSIAADLLELLVFGYATHDIEEFLMDELTEKGVKKLSNSVELSYATIQSLALYPLQCAALKMFYFLNAAKGLGRMKLFFEPLVSAESAEKAQRLCGAFVIKILEMSQVIDQCLHDMKIFFSWLCVVIVRLHQQDLTEEVPLLTTEDSVFLAEYLNSFEDNIIETDDGTTVKRKFNLEKVGQYFENKNLQEMAKIDMNHMWNKLLDENKCLANCKLVYPHEKRLSLVQQQDKFLEAVDEVFNKPNGSISDSFHHNSTIVCCDLPPGESADMDYVHSSFCYNSKTQSDMLVTAVGGEEVYILEFDKLFKMLKCTRLHLRPGPFRHELSSGLENLRFMDLQFYNETTISMLMQPPEQQDDTRRPQSHFIQFALDVVKGKHTEHILPTDVVSLKDLNVTNSLHNLLETISCKTVDGACTHLAVSGSRKVVSILSEDKRKMTIFEMEAEEDDDDMEASQNSLLEISKESTNSSHE